MIALTGTTPAMVELDETSGTWSRRPELDNLVPHNEGALTALSLPAGRVALWHIEGGSVLSPDGTRQAFPPGFASGEILGVAGSDIVGRARGQSAWPPAGVLYLD